MNIVLISSPLQLLNVYEYHKQYDVPINYLICVSKIERTFLQIKEVARYFGLVVNEYHKVNWLTYLFKLKRIAESISFADRLIVGHLFSQAAVVFINNISYNELIIVDDGLANVKSKKVIEELNSVIGLNKTQSFLMRFFNLNMSFPNEGTLFTLFDIPASEKLTVLKNSLSITKKTTQKKEVDNCTFIIGQPFVEMNELKLNDYTAIISQVVNQRKKNEIKYIAHRRESNATIEEIKYRCNIEIINSDLNFELYLVELERLPMEIIGFSSTVMITAGLILEGNADTQVISYRIPDKFIKNNSQKIKMCYSEIRNQGVMIRDLL